MLKINRRFCMSKRPVKSEIWMAESLAREEGWDGQGFLRPKEPQKS